MERRLLTFFIASTAFLMVYMSLRLMFQPPAPPKADEKAAVAQLEDAPGDEDAEGGPTIEAVGEDSDAADGQEGADEDETVQPQRPTTPTWYTLGSMDAEDGYQLLITLNSRGAGVERIELTKRDDRGELKYHRVDVRSGYLGYLAAQPASQVDGAIVQVVGPGTPADLAGLQTGDIITSIEDQPIRGSQDIEEAMLGSKPGQTIKLAVLRGESSNPLTLTAQLSEHPLDLVRLSRDGGIDQIKGNLSRLSCLMTLAQVNRKSILPDQRAISSQVDPEKLVWDASLSQSDGSAQTVEFSLDLSKSEMELIGGSSIRLRRSFSLQPGSYVVDMGLHVDNRSSETQDLAYRLEGANGVTLEGWWYSNKISPNFSGASARDLVYKTAAEDHELLSGYDLLKRARKEPKDPYQTLFAPDGDDASRDLRYIGVDAQYFAVAYIPTSPDKSFLNFRRAAGGLASDPDTVPRHQERAVNTTFYLDSVATKVPAGKSLTENLRLFAGPKEPELVEKHGLGRCVYYGWFALFAKPLSSLLHLLGGLVGNYGIAIVLLTVIVRGAMFPLSRKAAVNAQKMQELAPELKKITEKHKDDLEARMKAQRELQQRVGFNPMAGCLPMFMQLPIFIGLYRALSVDIELRQKAFFPGIDWASNLAAPDQLSYWGGWMMEYFSGRGTGWLGPYFNILPVIVVGLFLLQQKLFMPPATDEQTAMTQKMMGFMTLFMGLFFFRVPAGLCIYFITSSLWGICERVLVKKTLPAKTHFDPSVLEGSAKKTEEKPSSLTERIKNQVSKPEPTFERPNKRKRPKK